MPVCQVIKREVDLWVEWGVVGGQELWTSQKGYESGTAHSPQQHIFVGVGIDCEGLLDSLH